MRKLYAGLGVACSCTDMKSPIALNNPLITKAQTARDMACPYQSTDSTGGPWLSRYLTGSHV